MIRLQALAGWLIALFMVLALVSPVAAISSSRADAFAIPLTATLQDDDDDDDDWDDVDDDDDDWDDDDWDDDDWDDVDDQGDDDWDDVDDQGDDDWDDVEATDDDAWDDDDDDWEPTAPSAPIPPVQDDDDDDDDDGFDQPIANQAIVQLQPGVDPAGFANRHGAVVLRTIPGPNIVQLQLDPGQIDAEVVAAMQADADVIWSELNYTSQAPEGRPRYFFTSATGEPRIVDSPALPQGLEYTPAQACVSGNGIVVAVLDTGVDTSHPDIAGAVLPNGVNMLDGTLDVSDAGNGIDDDGDGQIDEMVGHGTHVTGTVLQVAPNASILPVKVLGSDGVGDTFSVTAGIHYAVDEGADVINLSLGSTFDSVAIRSAVDFAQGNGVVVVAAAGNGDRQEPAEYPAANPAAISVAATTRDADKAVYSNYHPSVNISAPGDDVASAYPGGLYTTASGTSMSAPLVSGTVALLLERQPGIAPERVLAVLETASGPLNLSDPSTTGLMGAGELDIDTSVACGS